MAISYEQIFCNNLYGTFKFCLKEFPEDFNTEYIIENSCNMANNHKDFQIIYDLIDINIDQDKRSLQKNILNSPNLIKYFIKNSPDLFNNMTVERYADLFKYFKNEPYYIRLIAKNIFNEKITLKAITDIYLRLPNRTLKKYFLKHNQYNDYNENTSVIISHIFKDYEAIEDFLRICKPTLDWNKIINSISEETFYRITSIINTMRHYPSVKVSYNTMKKTHQITIPKGYSKFIQNYIENYMKQNSFVNQVMNQPLERSNRDNEHIEYENFSGNHNGDFTARWNIEDAINNNQVIRPSPHTFNLEI